TAIGLLLESTKDMRPQQTAASALTDVKARRLPIKSPTAPQPTRPTTAPIRAMARKRAAAVGDRPKVWCRSTARYVRVQACAACKVSAQPVAARNRRLR